MLVRPDQLTEMSANEPIRILIVDDDPGVRRLLTILLLQEMTAENDGHAESVLVLTAISEVQLRRLPAGLRVWQVMRKPFDNVELLPSVKACSSRLAVQNGEQMTER